MFIKRFRSFSLERTFWVLVDLLLEIWYNIITKLKINLQALTAILCILQFCNPTFVKYIASTPAQN